MNVTYTAAAEGLVAWLNNRTASYNSSTVHVTLPSGNVARGKAPLRLPYGINLILQGSAMAGASNTTLDLESNNLEIGGMLGDGGRIEFRNMRVRNVRPSLARVAVCVLLMTPWLICAGRCGAPASADAGRCARRLRCLAALSSHSWCVLRVPWSRPCGPRLRSTASGGLLRGCVVARRVLCVVLRVASAAVARRLHVASMHIECCIESSLVCCVVA